jgi:hypothetical protein
VTTTVGPRHDSETKNPAEAGFSVLLESRKIQADFFFAAAFLVAGLVTVEVVPTTAGDTLCARELP